MAFRPMPTQVDLPALEHEVLARWRDRDVFARSLAATADGPLWTNDDQIFVRGEGGWGGDRGPSIRLDPPTGDPDATDADVKSLLATLRTSVASHLSAAQTINAGLP